MSVPDGSVWLLARTEGAIPAHWGFEVANGGSGFGCRSTPGVLWVLDELVHASHLLPAKAVEELGLIGDGGAFLPQDESENAHEVDRCVESLLARARKDRVLSPAHSSRFRDTRITCPAWVAAAEESSSASRSSDSAEYLVRSSARERIA